MLTSEHKALLERAAVLEKDGRMSSYAAGMWRHVVSSHVSGIPDTGENCDALPYVPVIPEDHDVMLTGFSRVLDIGCLGGYGLYDFAFRRKSAGMDVPSMSGLDVDSSSVDSGVAMAELWAPEGDVSFCRGKCEALPYSSGVFDLVVCRLVLPYVDVLRSISEITRVLKSGAIVVFQVHSPAYYVHSFLSSWRKPATAAYYLRPLLSYLVFRLKGGQPSWKWFAEMAMDTAALKSICVSSGLVPVWQGETRRKPVIVCRNVPVP